MIAFASNFLHASGVDQDSRSFSEIMPTEYLGLGMISSEADEDRTEMEESVQLKALRSPLQPSAEEVQKHNITHCPYRSWCRACVAGKGKSLAHKDEGYEASHVLPTLSIDYGFPHDRPVKGAPVAQTQGSGRGTRWRAFVIPSAAG